MIMLRHATAALLIVLCAGSDAANTSACDASEHRQFDFWLGEWNVRTPDGKLAGVNDIRREYNGCVLHERYSTARGYSGESLGNPRTPRVSGPRRSMGLTPGNSRRLTLEPARCPH